jgi:hypothetical protein
LLIGISTDMTTDDKLFYTHGFPPKICLVVYSSSSGSHQSGNGKGISGRNISIIIRSLLESISTSRVIQLLPNLGHYLRIMYLLLAAWFTSEFAGRDPDHSPSAVDTRHLQQIWPCCHKPNPSR